MLAKLTYSTMFGLVTTVLAYLGVYLLSLISGHPDAINPSQIGIGATIGCYFSQ